MRETRFPGQKLVGASIRRTRLGCALAQLVDFFFMLGRPRQSSRRATRPAGSRRNSLRTSAMAENRYYKRTATTLKGIRDRVFDCSQVRSNEIRRAILIPRISLCGSTIHPAASAGRKLAEIRGSQWDQEKAFNGCKEEDRGGATGESQGCEERLAKSLRQFPHLSQGDLPFDST